jgi:hypothetical protein
VEKDECISRKRCGRALFGAVQRAVEPQAVLGNRIDKFDVHRGLAFHWKTRYGNALDKV